MKDIIYIDHISLIQKNHSNRNKIDKLDNFLSSFRKRQKRICKINNIYF